MHPQDTALVDDLAGVVGDIVGRFDAMSSAQEAARSAVSSGRARRPSVRKRRSLLETINHYADDIAPLAAAQDGFTRRSRSIVPTGLTSIGAWWSI